MMSTRFCILATGNLSTPRVPDFSGSERFRGPWFHSAQWRAEGVDFAGQRVGLVGTGRDPHPNDSEDRPSGPASHGFTAHGQLQRAGPQRTPRRRPPPCPQGNLPRAAADGPSPDLWRIWRANPSRRGLDLSDVEREATYERLWREGGSAYFLSAFTDLLVDESANETASDFVRRQIRSIVHDPKKADILAPTDHPIGTKRLCVDTDYNETF